ncbi:MAG: hypothetical protein J7M14_05255 [Planctomycetes bacterium]|nr:hypothetical protein [Planctomycetota bacterium]
MRYRMSSPPSDDEFDHYGVSKAEIIKYALIAVVVVVVGAATFVWTQCRIDVPSGYFVPLLKKTGANMTNDMVLATADYKGPQFEILKEGRHFRNPYFWGWTKPVKATVVDKGKVGIRVRRRGEPLPLGQVIVSNDKQKGILAEVLKPGRYYINLREYDIELHDMVNIRAGFRGVVTLLVGKTPEDPNVFVVKDGERGTQATTLEPGLHEDFSNPYLYMVTEIDTRSQKFDMADKYAITFPSKSGFDIRVEGTIEWAPELAKLPELFVKYVDEQDMEKSGGIDNIQRKIILPYARSFCRTIGGRYRAVDFITGDTRIKVQKDVERELKRVCREEGINIKSFVIRSTIPPERIREQYQRREMAARQIKQYEMEIKTEIGSVVLDENDKARIDEQGRKIREGGRLAKIIQEREKDRQTKLGGVRQQIAVVIREAEKYHKVEVTKAQKDLEVARIRLEAAKDKAAKTIAEGKAKAYVMVANYKAEAAAVNAKISAFKTGDMYAEYQLIIKLAPGIERILSNTEGLFADLFRRFSAKGETK